MSVLEARFATPIRAFSFKRFPGLFHARAAPPNQRSGVDWRTLLRRYALKPAMRHGAVTFTVLLALIGSSMFMSITGGVLTPHERRTIAATVASFVLADAAARERLAQDLDRPYPPRRSVHVVPVEPIALPGPPVDADVALLGGDLLGAPAPVRRLRRAPVVVAVSQRLPAAQAALAPVEQACTDKCLTPIAADAGQVDVAVVAPKDAATFDGVTFE
jgi:hypothetical protein